MQNYPFPINYNPYYPYQQPPAPQYQQANMQQMAGQPHPVQQPQAMTYPTIHADIVQTDDEGVIERWGVTQDKPQMFIDHAETVITIKSVGGNGVVTDRYDKRPPAPAAPRFDPGDYVTKEELESRLAAILAPKRAAKKETEAEG